MKQNRSFAAVVLFVILGVGAALACARYRMGANFEASGIGVSAFVLALVVASAIQVADQRDGVLVLRLGHFHALKGPGLFFMIPQIRARDRDRSRLDHAPSGRGIQRGMKRTG